MNNLLSAGSTVSSVEQNNLLFFFFNGQLIILHQLHAITIIISSNFKYIFSYIFKHTFIPFTFHSIFFFEFILIQLQSEINEAEQNDVKNIIYKHVKLTHINEKKKINK